MEEKSVRIVHTNVIKTGKFMANINLRINDDLKARAFAELERIGVTPSEALRQTLEYIAENERPPFKKTLLSDEDAQLTEIARERLHHLQPVRVNLDDL